MSEGHERWLPLFPLELVLFPGAILPLHIFEPRYRAMTARCEAESSGFGVMLLEDGNLSRIGCEARIIQVLQRYPDGRFDLLARGTDRFGLNALREHDDGYLEGEVLSMPDEPEPKDPDLRRALLVLYQEFRRHADEDENENEQAPVEAPVALSDVASTDDEGYTFALAMEARMDTRERQELLETVSERQREQLLIRHLARVLPIVRNQEANRRRVKGNGKPEPSE